MIVLTAVLAVAMWVRGHRRAAVFAVGVMLATWGLTTVLKVLVGRERPEWQLADELLSTKSFPSGHASAITAFAGVLAVLVAMLVRRGNLRRLAYVGLVLLAVAVCLDRVLLGPSLPLRRDRRRAARRRRRARWGWRRTPRCR